MANLIIFLKLTWDFTVIQEFEILQFESLMLYCTNVFFFQAIVMEEGKVMVIVMALTARSRPTKMAPMTAIHCYRNLPKKQQVETSMMKITLFGKLISRERMGK